MDGGVANGDNTQSVAAHEAGHVVVAMATGTQVLEITGVDGELPDSSLMGPQKMFYTKINIETLLPLDARLTYLWVVGGFAGEATHEGVVERQGALDDLSALRKAHLTDFQIQLLTGVAMEIIDDNRKLWEMIHDAVLLVIETGQTPPTVPGNLMHARFERIGKRFTNMARIDEVLPLD